MPAESPDGSPSACEIRAALGHIITSEAFRGSPQLVAFLRYVVEAALRGEADRIKGYTIAVEALGRNPDFDPQVDPIVRVEAMRLRRALGRYYSAVSDDSVRIDLPLGTYVPVFSRSCPALAIAPVSVETPLHVAPPVVAKSAARLFALPQIKWRRVLTGAALVLLGAASYGAFDFWVETASPTREPGFFGAQAGTVAEPGRVGTAFPIVFVGLFQANRDAGDTQVIANTVRAKLRDALARFDEISVINGPPLDAARARLAGEAVGVSRYSLTARVETADAGQLSLDIRLTDISDDRVAFVRTFRQPNGKGDLVAAEEAIVREVSAALAQPYGVIYSYERANHATTGDPRYRCLLDSYEYWRTYEPSLHARARACLEHATAADPGFAAGFALLAELDLHEHRRALNPRPGDAPPLDRALRAARRAVEARPGSARAYQALMNVQFLRGEYALALSAGEKALELNPYDPNILALYGARLVGLGEVDKGARLLKDAAKAIAVRPPWFDFYLFLAAYLMDDKTAAASYVAQIVSDKSQLGFVARALAAMQRGDVEGARQAVAGLVDLRPGWRNDPEAELRKFAPADPLASRLVRDLARAGLGAMN